MGYMSEIDADFAGQYGLLNGWLSAAKLAVAKHAGTLPDIEQIGWLEQRTLPELQTMLSSNIDPETAVATATVAICKTLRMTREFVAGMTVDRLVHELATLGRADLDERGSIARELLSIAADIAECVDPDTYFPEFEAYARTSDVLAYRDGVLVALDSAVQDDLVRSFPSL